VCVRERERERERENRQEQASFLLIVKCQEPNDK
jgi:hypothetical protein